MNEELRLAMLEQAESRAEYNAVKPDDETALGIARQRLNSADAEVIRLLSESRGGAPAELADRIELRRYLNAAATESRLEGAEAELNTELRLAENVVPLEAMLPTTEERADAISPQDGDGDALAFGNINRTRGTLLRRVFTRTDATALGIAMPTVPPGERIYPVMTDGTTAAMQARGSGPDSGAAKFDVVNATPKRLTGRYIFDLEGVAELGALLESTLRADLRAEMGFQMDRQILLGTGKDNQVSGLLNQLTLTAPPGSAFSTNDISAVINWNTARQIATGGLDGKYSRTERDIRLMIGTTTYSILRAAYRGTTTDNQDAIQALQALGASVRHSFQMPAPAVATISPKSAASSKKVQSAIVNSEPGAAVAPVWQGVTLIRDPYTNAKTAQIVLTAHMLFDFVMRRKDGWKRYAIRTET